jgi:hypothetical protein
MFYRNRVQKDHQYLKRSNKDIGNKLQFHKIFLMMILNLDHLKIVVIKLKLLLLKKIKNIIITKITI